MIYIILLLLIPIIILSHSLAKADQKKIVDELTEMLRLEEWQIRVLKKYLRG